MRNHFDRQLEELNVELITMGALCEDAISLAVKALLTSDLSLTDKVYETDVNIDNKEREIENLCMKLLMQQQPVARDLRVISSALKMISDMERIGDQARDIADITKHVKNSDATGRVHIKEMALAVIKMVTDSIDSFVSKDLDLAYKVMSYDDIVDEFFVKIKNELVEIIRSDNEYGADCVDLLMIAKYLERIGDHATNIAEWVEYSITGVHKNAEQW